MAGLAFFDTAAVLAATDAAERRALSKFGAYVRQRALGSLRYRDRPSAPGQPPSVHRTARRRVKNRKTGVVTVQAVSPLKAFLFFAFDLATRSTVIGPAKASGVSGTAPATLEFGGRTPGRFPKYQAPRPTMGPALKAETPRFAQLFKDAFSGGP